MRHFTNDISWEKKIAVFLIAIAILSFLGPFGTYAQLNLQERFVYWTVLLVSIGFFMIQSMTVTLNTPYLGKLAGVLRLGIGAAIAAIPGVAILIFVKMVFEIDGAAETQAIPLWGKITALGWLYGTVEYLDWRAPDTPKKNRETALHKRLPSDIGMDVISLTMQDHYVEVTTTHGNELILMRLRDAIKELDGIEGVQIHRSHWVAADHLVSITKSGARHIAKLTDGRKLPISATYFDTAKAVLDAKGAA